MDGVTSILRDSREVKRHVFNFDFRAVRCVLEYILASSYKLRGIPRTYRSKLSLLIFLRLPGSLLGRVDVERGRLARGFLSQGEVEAAVAEHVCGKADLGAVLEVGQFQLE